MSRTFSTYRERNVHGAMKAMYVWIQPCPLLYLKLIRRYVSLDGRHELGLSCQASHSCFVSHPHGLTGLEY